MNFLTPGEAPDAGLRRIIREKTVESIETLSLAAADPVYAVHEVRKNIKRIRAALRLARFALGQAGFRQENFAFRDMGRRLASARDAAVLRETLRLILRSAEIPEDEISLIERDLFGLVSEPGAELDLHLAGELMDSFRAAGGNVMKAEMVLDESDFVYDGLAHTAEKARRAYKNAYAPPETAEKFHEWRKQVKYLWHQFEFLAELGGPGAEIPTEDLEHLAGQLGLAHDAANLHAWLIREKPTSAVVEFSRLVRLVHRIRLDHEGAARPHGRALFTQEPKALLSWYPQVN